MKFGMACTKVGPNAWFWDSTKVEQVYTFLQKYKLAELFY